jgi:uncharacterized protein (TIGR02118 family)
VYKLTLIFYENASTPDLIEHWSNEFVPLADKLPGLQLVVVSHVEGGPAGPSNIRLIQDLVFEDKAALTAAMQSPQGVAAGQCLVRLTRNQPNTVTMLFAEHMEDTPQPTPSENPRSFT